MRPPSSRVLRIACSLGGLLLVAPPARVSGTQAVAISLGHVPVAVRDLEQASATYRAMGFAIKPGRAHVNGIRNAHVKFPDGSGIELITADKAADALTARYVEFLTHGDGPAFLAFHARETEPLVSLLRRGGYACRREGDLTELRDPGLDNLFFVRDNRSPTDRPEHFAHGNSATALRAVWMAPDTSAHLERLLLDLGGSSTRRTVEAPDAVTATVVSIGAGEVVILPTSHQVLAGRAIVGVTISVRNADEVTRRLLAAGISARRSTGASRRCVVPPSATHGLWMAFTQ